MSGLIVTAQIIKCLPHPDAKKLKLCHVFDGQEEHQIVCGAANAHEGMITILAKIGSTLKTGIKIEKATFRGVDSFGMLCSAKELGLQDEGEIVDLPPGTILGAPFEKLHCDLISSVPWYQFEEKEAFWLNPHGRDIQITRNGRPLENKYAGYRPLSKTYWNKDHYVYRNY